MTENRNWPLPYLLATTETSIRCVPVERARIGLIAPNNSRVMEEEWTLVTPPGITYLITGLMVESVTPQALEKVIGHIERAAMELAMAGAQAIIQCGTPVGFLRGYGWDKEIASRIAAATGLPATAMATAVVEALGELGIRKVAVGTAYGDPVNEILHKFLTDSGFQVLALKGLQKTDAAEIKLLTSETPYQLAREVYGLAPEADGVLVSCGLLRSMDFIDRLEREIGKPVTTSNQAAVRAVLKLAGVWQPVEGYGRLLEMA
ncbi:MAG: aspartate/glutamate racemase family protein [Dehalococcoidia bacterium]|nr:aspartate/glutamate racemase family protein [Dehalococcoidia bacterium]